MRTMKGSSQGCRSAGRRSGMRWSVMGCSEKNTVARRNSVGARFGSERVRGGRVGFEEAQRRAGGRRRGPEMLAGIGGSRRRGMEEEEAWEKLVRERN